MKNLDIFKPRHNYRPFDFKQAEEFARIQRSIFWPPERVDVSSDLLEFNTKFTPAEQHGITSNLKLFTLYEIHVGDYWLDYIYPRFQKHEFRMMASMMGCMELNSHGPFYDKLNAGLNLDTKEFYIAFLDDPVLTERMNMIDSFLVSDNVPLSIAVFSLIEGVVLYSSFAFLLHFQANGKNKLSNVCTGVAYSVRDENLHAEAGSWLYNTVVSQPDFEKDESLIPSIKKAAKALVANEDAIIDQIFAKGAIKGITARQLKNFVRSRANMKLKDIGIDPIYEIDYNPIAKWFYKFINMPEFTDFFHNEPTEYSMNWDFTGVKYNQIDEGNLYG